MHQTQYETIADECLFHNYARYPITLTHGEGAYVWDCEDKKYLDFLAGIACTPLGHQHPAVTHAIIDQAKKLLHTSNLYYSPPGIELAAFLVKHGGLDKIFFCNSGTEANEAAIKLARKYHWNRGDKNKNVILSVNHSFHGRTLGSLAATGKTSIQIGFGPMPAHFHHLDWDDTAAFCKAIDDNVAAVIIEPIQGEGGIQIAPAGFLEAVRVACDRAKALLIFDEVQCGVGRTGTLFAYQQTKVIPDVITLAKGIANGLPLGVVCATNEFAAAFTPGDHGTTFGGNPVSCRAALATLDIIAAPDFLKKINMLAAYLEKSLKNLQKKYPALITEIRGAGLMRGVCFKQHAKSILQYCQAHGLLANITAENILRLLPPYIIAESDIDMAINIIDAALHNTASP